MEPSPLNKLEHILGPPRGLGWGGNIEVDPDHLEYMCATFLYTMAAYSHSKPGQMRPALEFLLEKSKQDIPTHEVVEAILENINRLEDAVASDAVRIPWIAVVTRVVLAVRTEEEDSSSLQYCKDLLRKHMNVLNTVRLYAVDEHMWNLTTEAKRILA